MIGIYVLILTFYHTFSLYTLFYSIFLTNQFEVWFLSILCLLGQARHRTTQCILLLNRNCSILSPLRPFLITEVDSFKVLYIERESSRILFRDVYWKPVCFYSLIFVFMHTKASNRALNVIIHWLLTFILKFISHLALLYVDTLVVFFCVFWFIVLKIWIQFKFLLKMPFNGVIWHFWGQNRIRRLSFRL